MQYLIHRVHETSENYAGISQVGMFLTIKLTKREIQIAVWNILIYVFINTSAQKHDQDFCNCHKEEWLIFQQSLPKLNLEKISMTKQRLMIFFNHSFFTFFTYNYSILLKGYSTTSKSYNLVVLNDSKFVSK